MKCQVLVETGDKPPNLVPLQMLHPQQTAPGSSTLKPSVCRTFTVTLKYSCIITIGAMFYVPFICTQ